VLLSRIRSFDYFGKIGPKILPTFGPAGVSSPPPSPSIRRHAIDGSLSILLSVGDNNRAREPSSSTAKRSDVGARVPVAGTRSPFVQVKVPSTTAKIAAGKLLGTTVAREFFKMSAASLTTGGDNVDVSKMCAAHRAVDKHVKVSITDCTAPTTKEKTLNVRFVSGRHEIGHRQWLDHRIRHSTIG